MGIRKNTTVKVDQTLYDRLTHLKKQTSKPKNELLEECMLLILIKYGIFEDTDHVLVTDPSIFHTTEQDLRELSGLLRPLTLEIDQDIYRDIKLLATTIKPVKPDLSDLFNEGLMYLVKKYNI